MRLIKGLTEQSQCASGPSIGRQPALNSGNHNKKYAIVEMANRLIAYRGRSLRYFVAVLIDRIASMTKLMENSCIARGGENGSFSQYWSVQVDLDAAEDSTDAIYARIGAGK